MQQEVLNQNELEVLRILWEQGELKPAEIEEHFAWPIKNATLRSILVNLVDKGHVRREARGKAFYYAAAVPRTTLLQGMLHTLTRVFSSGSHRELVAHLVETGDIKPDDLRLLARMATPTKTKQKKKVR